jgi:hypothetical protein
MRQLLVAVALIFCTCTVADVVDARRPTARSQTDSSELVQLKAQNAELREFHSSLLDTVYWALSTVVTFTALLAGFSWFSNFKLYEADKHKLKEELTARVQEAFTIVESKLSAHDVEVSKLVDSKLEAETVRAARDIDLLRSEVSKGEETLSKALAQAQLSLDKVLTTSEVHKKKISESEAMLRQVEEHVWDMKGVPANILVTQSQGIRAAIAADDRYYVSNVLTRMKGTLSTNMSALEMGKETRDLVETTLSEAAKIDPTSASEVLELLGKVRIRSSPV